jgi:hypothetical protein
MGVAVIGGLMCGGGLTLFVIPAMYVLMRRKPLQVCRWSRTACEAPTPWRMLGGRSAAHPRMSLAGQADHSQHGSSRIAAVFAFAMQLRKFLQ